MPAIITQNMRIKGAEFFRNMVKNEAVYLYIGRNSSWKPTDANIEIPKGNNTEDRQIRDNIHAVKKVEYINTSLASPRYNWVGGTVYHEYDDADPQMHTKMFYCVTDDFSVYKCIKSSGNPSVIKPTSKSPDTTELTEDGYIWKYMYTITTSQATKFLTSSHIPVDTLKQDDSASGGGISSSQWIVQQAAVPGAIHNIKIMEHGSGYTNATVTVEGDGTGCTATATVTDGIIEDIVIDNIGQGYTHATVTIQGDGNGAEARVIISPKGGHGSDPIHELKANYVITNVILNGQDVGDMFPIGNKFRQLGLILNPTDSDGDIINDATSRPLYSLEYTDLTNGLFSTNDIIQGSTSNAKGVIVYIDSDTNTIYYTQDEINTGYKAFQKNERITVNDRNIIANISKLNSPLFDKYSGDILYIENRAPILRADGQIEDIKIVLEY